MARPLKCLRPGLVAEPVADEVGITSIDEDRDLLEDAGNKSVERHHPVTLEEEVAVDIEVAGLVVADFYTQRLLNVILVEVVADPAELGVAEVVAILAFATDIIDVLAGALVWADHSVVAVDGSGDTRPD